MDNNFPSFPPLGPEDLDTHTEYDADSEDEQFLATVNATKKQLSAEKLEIAIDKFEKEAFQHPNQEITPARAEALLKQHSVGVRKEVLVPLLEHWKAKRAARNGNSLLLRFQKPPAFDDPSPYVAFRPREKDKEKFKKIRKNDATALAKMRSLRQEMERSRTLLEMLKKREKLKKDNLTVVTQIYEQLLLEISVKTEDDVIRPPPLKIQKKSTVTPPLSSSATSFSSSVASSPPAIASPVPDHPRPKPIFRSRGDYYYDYVSVNSRLKISPADAAVPYVVDPSFKQLQQQQQQHQIVKKGPNPYPSLLNTFSRTKNSLPLIVANDDNNDDEISDFENDDELLFEDEEEKEEKSDSKVPTTPEVMELMAKLDQKAKFPRQINNHIALSRESKPFRGRARLGRGGRILFDRPLQPHDQIDYLQETPSYNNSNASLSTSDVIMHDAISPTITTTSTYYNSPRQITNPNYGENTGNTSSHAITSSNSNSTNNNNNIINNKVNSNATHKKSVHSYFIFNDNLENFNTNNSNNSNNNGDDATANNTDYTLQASNSTNHTLNSETESTPNVVPSTRSPFLTTLKPDPDSSDPNPSPPSPVPPSSPSSPSPPHSQSPPLSPPSCIDKIPAVMHTYSKKQKRKLLDNTIALAM